MTDTTPTTPAPAKGKRGRPPLDPAHGPLSASERSARRRAALTEIGLHGQPSATWARVELLKALGLELATLDLLPTADRSRAAQIVAAIMAKYELNQIEWNFEVADGETA